MRRTVKNKKGFTLLEMMLSIAIITIVSGCLVTLMVSIKDSYISTYNSDDSTDYAMLYSKALENSILSVVQDHKGTNFKETKWKLGDYTDGTGVTHAALFKNTEAIFKPSMMSVTTKKDGVTKDKWKVVLTFDPDINITPNNGGTTKGMINYTITIYDNYYDPNAPVKCVHKGGFWLPQFNNGTFTVEDGGKTLHFVPAAH